MAKKTSEIAAARILAHTVDYGCERCANTQGKDGRAGVLRALTQFAKLASDPNVPKALHQGCDACFAAGKGSQKKLSRLATCGFDNVLLE